MKTSVREKDGSSGKSTVFTGETLGVVFLLFSAFAFICLISRDKIFSAPGQVVNRFLLGTFGYFAYPITLYFIVRGIMLIVGKKMPGSFKVKALSFVMLVLLSAIVHAITMHGNSSLSYGEYLSLCYNLAEGGAATCSGGGFIAGLYTYLFTALLTDVGAYVVLSVLIALTGYGFYQIYAGKTQKPAKEEPNGSFVVEETQSAEPTVAQASATATPEQTYATPAATYTAPVQQKPTSKLYVANSSAFEFKGKKDFKDADNIKLSYAQDGLTVANVSYSANYSDELKSKIEYIKTPVKIVPETVEDGFTSEASETKVSEPIAKTQPESPELDVPVIPLYERDGDKDDVVSRAESFGEKYADAEDGDTLGTVKSQADYYPVSREIAENTEPVQPESASRNDRREEFSSRLSAASTYEEPEFYDGETEEPEFEPFDEPAAEPADKPAAEPVEEPKIIETPRRRARDFFASEEKSEPAVKEPVVEEKPPKEIPPINREYFRPPLDLLASPVRSQSVNTENHEERMEIIKRTLEEFHISAEPQNYVQGPAITQYAFKIPAGVIVSKVLGYADNLQMRLEVKEGVRIQAPIPGKDLIGIEVANRNRETITLRELMESPAASQGKPTELRFAIGKNIVGECIFDNLAKGVHYLVAGSTGSGKSVCLHALITSLIMRYSPEDLRLIFIDPKRVEFPVYKHLPHLMSDEIVSDPKRAVAVLSWAIEEMERRYKIFEDQGGLVDNIESYNEYVANDTVAKMPRIVIVVDELADLMSVCKKDVESRIARLAAKARAAGIHLVLTTQRPSVDVITGVIKSNLPSRIALKVSNFNDSQTIMNEAGAEKLLGNGDMLYKNAGMNNFERYLGAYITKPEIFNVVKYIKEHNKAYYDDDFKNYLENSVNPKPEEPVVADTDDAEPSDSNAEIFIRALAYAVNTGKVSISLIQRRFQIGYIRAAGLIDRMEQSGYIAPSEGSKSRSVYLTREQFEEKFGPMSDVE